MAKKDFNSFGSRRGNDRVMVRGTFANIRLKNLLVPGREGGVTLHFPGRRAHVRFTMPPCAIKQEGVPLLVIAGKEYGSGSSRDWAAKGTLLLGVRAVLAESLRAHPSQQPGGHGRAAASVQRGRKRGFAGLTGQEVFDIAGLSDGIRPRSEVTVTAVDPDGARRSFQAIARLDSAVEVNYFSNGGILPTVLRSMLKSE